MGGGQLADLEHFVALTKDTETVYLKKHSYVIFNCDSSAEISERLITGEYKVIEIPSGTIKVEGLKYGFKMNIYVGYTKQFPKATIDCTNYDSSSITTMESMFQLHDGTQPPNIIIGKLNTSSVTDMNCMFINTNIVDYYNLSSFDTSKVTNMGYMFHGCNALTSLELNNWNTSAVDNMRHMFASCTNLTSLDLSSFDTSNVTDMGYMFQSCSGLTSLDLSNWNTSKVDAMPTMFASCTNLTSLDLSSFDTSQVTNMNDMFRKCDKLTHIKCKQSFKDWCIANKDTINLPQAMIDGTVGTDSSCNWEIVDYVELE